MGKTLSEYILALIMLLCLCAMTGAQGADDLFGERFIGDGAHFETFELGDELYPININNVWGYANQDGEIIVLPEFDWCDVPHNRLMRVIMGGRTGFVRYNKQNRQPEWIVKTCI